MLSGRAPAAPYSAVLTFDDGCRNNLTHAMPILRRYGAPAVFFVPTSHIHRRRPFWFDRLDYALQQADVDGREVRVAGRSVRLAGGGREALAGSYARLRQLAKAVTRSDWEFRDEMDGLASELEAQSGCALADIYEQDDWSAVLTAEEIRSAAGGDVTFGSHTADHVRLGLVNEDVTREQLLSSKRAMEELTSRPCVHFCYPNGSYNSRTPSLVRECGYACAVTSNEGLNRPGDDMMLLRRVNLPSGCVSDTELLVRVSGLSAALRELKSHLARRLSRRRREGGAVRMGPPSAEAQRRPSE
jgi:peptidoglycan/xylan/chitin deacetylase (PgdA/CDA1 family)